MQTSVLVTGGSGFIGTWVLRRLLELDLHPVAFDLRESRERWKTVLGKRESAVTYVSGSLLEREKLAEVVRSYNVTHIIHLAALLTPACQQDPWNGAQINLMGSMALFEVAREFKSQIQGFSYASSYAVYGPEVDDAARGMKANENRPPTFYGAFKLAVDLIAEQYWRHFQISSVGIRPHVAFGPERTEGLTAGPSLAARAAQRGERYRIGYRGRVGYDYVEDAARAFVRAALETPPGSHLIDLPSELATTEDFVRLIEEALPSAAGLLSVEGPEIPANIPPEPHPITELYPDWERTPLSVGIRRTIEFYQRKASA